MREWGPLRVKVIPETAEAYALAKERLSLSRTFLGQLKQRMGLGGLSQGTWRRELPDGTKITLSSVFGQDNIIIDVRSSLNILRMTLLLRFHRVHTDGFAYEDFSTDLTGKVPYSSLDAEYFTLSGSYKYSKAKSNLDFTSISLIGRGGECIPNWQYPDYSTKFNNYRFNLYSTTSTWYGPSYTDMAYVSSTRVFSPKIVSPVNPSGTLSVGGSNRVYFAWYTTINGIRTLYIADRSTSSPTSLRIRRYNPSTSTWAVVFTPTQCASVGYFCASEDGRSLSYSITREYTEIYPGTATPYIKEQDKGIITCNIANDGAITESMVYEKLERVPYTIITGGVDSTHDWIMSGSGSYPLIPIYNKNTLNILYFNYNIYQRHSGTVTGIGPTYHSIYAGSVINSTSLSLAGSDIIENTIISNYDSEQFNGFSPEVTADQVEVSGSLYTCTPVQESSYITNLSTTTLTHVPSLSGNRVTVKNMKVRGTSLISSTKNQEVSLLTLYSSSPTKWPVHRTDAPNGITAPVITGRGGFPTEINIGIDPTTTTTLLEMPDRTIVAAFSDPTAGTFAKLIDQQNRKIDLLPIGGIFEPLISDGYLALFDAYPHFEIV